MAKIMLRFYLGVRKLVVCFSSFFTKKSGEKNMPEFIFDLLLYTTTLKLPKTWFLNKVDKSQYPCRTNPRILKQCRSTCSIVMPLCITFKKSIESVQLPSAFKIANATAT